MSGPAYFKNALKQYLNEHENHDNETKPENENKRVRTYSDRHIGTSLKKMKQASEDFNISESTIHALFNRLTKQMVMACASASSRDKCDGSISPIRDGSLTPVHGGSVPHISGCNHDTTVVVVEDAGKPCENTHGAKAEVTGNELETPQNVPIEHVGVRAIEPRSEECAPNDSPVNGVTEISSIKKILEQILEVQNNQCELLASFVENSQTQEQTKLLERITRAIEVRAEGLH